MDQVTELNNLWKTAAWPLGTFLMFAVVAITANVFARFLLPPDYVKLRTPWVAMVAAAIALVGLSFLMPKELRLCAIILGLVCSVALCITLRLMIWVLMSAVQRSKRFGFLVWVVGLLLANFAFVRLATWPEVRFLGQMAGLGILGGVIGSLRELIRPVHNRKGVSD